MFTSVLPRRRVLRFYSMSVFVVFICCRRMTLWSFRGRVSSISPRTTPTISSSASSGETRIPSPPSPGLRGVGAVASVGVGDSPAYSPVYSPVVVMIVVVVTVGGGGSHWCWSWWWRCAFWCVCQMVFLAPDRGVGTTNLWSHPSSVVQRFVPLTLSLGLCESPSTVLLLLSTGRAD